MIDQQLVKYQQPSILQHMGDMIQSVARGTDRAQGREGVFSNPEMSLKEVRRLCGERAPQATLLARSEMAWKSRFLAWLSRLAASLSLIEAAMSSSCWKVTPSLR